MRRSLIAVAVIGTIAFNALANLLPLNGRTTGEIASTFRVQITPAGYVFSIWSLIYIGLLAYAAYQWRVAGPGAIRLRRIEGPVLVSCAANVAWLALWHYGLIAATLIAMLALLAALALIHRRLRHAPLATRTGRWCVDRPFSVYFGWITVATLVNLSVVLEYLGARPFGLDAAPWALAMLACTALIALLVARWWGDRWFLGVLAWAAVGIAVANRDFAVLAWSAGAVAVICAAAIVWTRRLHPAHG
jgi:hypothetical protein